MAEAPHTLEGWYVLHDFRRFHWGAWRDLDEAERQAVSEELQTTYLDPLESYAGEGYSVWYAIGGHKADLLFMHLRPTLDDVLQLELTLNVSRFADYMTQVFAFVSVTEFGHYTGGPEHVADSPRKQAQIQRRLYPQKPDYGYLSFYPLNKRRDEINNWYTLPIEERQRLIYQYGLVGRKHSGDVLQFITGAIGFDDWEWGVTLQSNNPLALKKLVQEMRFEESNAKYVEFGPCFVGKRLNQRLLFDYLAGKLVPHL